MTKQDNRTSDNNLNGSFHAHKEQQSNLVLTNSTGMCKSVSYGRDIRVM